jgi:3-phosphoglycerate kinase
MQLPAVTDITDLKGVRVLLRSGLNVPLKDGKVANPFRLKKAIETIDFLKSAGARVIIVAHIGRDKTESLRPVYDALSMLTPCGFAPDWWSAETKTLLDAMIDGDAVLLENVRQFDGETENDPGLAQKMAGLADVYVNDAFADSHREHASIVGVCKYLPSYAGFLFAKEVAQLSKALAPQHPSLFILGGAKFETKEPILRACLPLYDAIFVGGALAHDFLRARGLPIGTSLASDDVRGVDDLVSNPKIILPVDVMVRSQWGVFVKTPDEVHEDEKIVDCGPATIALLQEKIQNAKCVLWNGPLGNYEEGYAARTEELAKIVADANGVSIVGGGDTVASIDALNLEEKFTFVSTGGGAMLDFLADGSLPSIDAIIASHNR